MVLNVRKLEDEGVEAAKPLAMQESSQNRPSCALTGKITLPRVSHFVDLFQSYLSSYGINL
jgi:hypothetical protein